MILFANALYPSFGRAFLFDISRAVRYNEINDPKGGRADENV